MGLINITSLMISTLYIYKNLEVSVHLSVPPDYIFYLKKLIRTSLVVQWLRLHALPPQGAWVRSLVRELRSCMPCHAVKKNEKKKETYQGPPLSYL